MSRLNAKLTSQLERDMPESYTECYPGAPEQYSEYGRVKNGNAFRRLKTALLSSSVPGASLSPEEIGCLATDGDACTEPAALEDIFITIEFLLQRDEASLSLPIPPRFLTLQTPLEAEMQFLRIREDASLLVHCNLINKTFEHDCIECIEWKQMCSSVTFTFVSECKR
ncbi:hypothetical protein NPIL_370861 [Nephila pilipes]|uniref:Uncharacterized protein n=1 Tax=Nephila pilipes TaxID=299642 RepID=A0A8X6PXQ7_NEPPI|nr:hypothetical protein NPIL_370861 [Nephila pilipes]